MSLDNGVTVPFYAVQFAGLIRYAEIEGTQPARIVLKKKDEILYFPQLDRKGREWYFVGAEIEKSW